MKSRPNRSLCRLCIRKILTQKCFCTKFPFLYTLLGCWHCISFLHSIQKYDKYLDCFRLSEGLFSFSQSENMFLFVISLLVSKQMKTLNAENDTYGNCAQQKEHKKIMNCSQSRASCLEHSLDGEWSGNEKMESDAPRFRFGRFPINSRAHRIQTRYTVRIGCQNHRLINGKN